MLVSPISRTGLVVGYVLGFGVLATLQSLGLLGAGVAFLGVEFEPGVELFFLVELLGAMTALDLGIVLSLFARNEFQVLPFMSTGCTPSLPRPVPRTTAPAAGPPPAA